MQKLDLRASQITEQELETVNSANHSGLFPQQKIATEVSDFNSNCSY